MSQLDRQEKEKQTAAHLALNYIEYGMTIGVGSGSTVNYFIDALAPIKNKIDAAVAASIETEKRLKAIGIPVIDLNQVSDLPIYIDSADEINSAKQMIKGGGGALTREKIIAAVATKFICMIHRSKLVDLLGSFPIPIEVIPIARSFVARQVVKLGGQPVWREGIITDNGNILLDIFNLKLLNPIELESQLNQIPGVVCNGIFAHRPANEILIGET